MNESIIRKLRASQAAFRAILRLDNGQLWQPDPWQRDWFERMDGGWQRAIGRDVPGGCSRGWSIRARGHSKTFDAAVQIAWATFAAPREMPVTGVVAASDQDQAAFVADGVRRLVRANPWLAEFVEVQRGRIINAHTESQCTILASDAPSSLGILADYILCDELTTWKARPLFDSLLSAAAKKPNCLFSIISNAGVIGDWRHEFWLAIQDDPAWEKQHLPGCVASWISQAALEEQRRLLPPNAFLRLWDNQFAPDSGDAIPASLIDQGTLRGSPPQTLAADYCSPVGGVDLSRSRNWSAFVVTAISRVSRKVVTVHVKVWKPPPGGEVDVDEIENHILNVRARLGLDECLLDPWGAGQMLQRLNKRGCYSRLIPPTPRNLGDSARLIFEGFREKQFQIYKDGDGEILVSDLKKLSIIESPGVGNTSFRLTAPVAADGSHADAASAWILSAAQNLLYLRHFEVRLQIEQSEAEQQRQIGRDSTWGQPVDQVDRAFDMRTEFPRRRPTQ